MNPFKLFVSLAVVVFAGCATNSAAVRSVDASELGVDQANEVIAVYQNRRALRHAEISNDPLGKPKSLADVVEILHRDQMDFFPEALKFAATQDGPEALALRAQIQLAWGEAQLILDEMLQRSTARLRVDANELEMKRQAGGLNPQQLEKLNKLKSTVSELGGLGEALVRAGGQHISEGAALTEQLMTKYPNDYKGYRVAADLYRLRGDWVRFDDAMVKLQTANPNSNGLLFARGMEALVRKQDRVAASKFFEEALKKDPKFARARAQLMLTQSDLIAVHDELAKLKEASPHHQLVVWVGPAIENHYQTWLDRSTIMPKQQVDGSWNSADLRNSKSDTK